MAVRTKMDAGTSKPKYRYRVTNWAKYDRALVSRGDLTIWFDEATIKDGWTPPPSVGRGTGVRYSVLDVVKAFEAASGQPVPYRIGPRRPGDVAACYADPRLAIQLLGWKAERDLAAMCQDHWRWQKHNPQGYL